MTGRVTRDEGLSKIREAVAESLAIDVEEIRSDSTLVDDLGADSLDFIDLIFVFEQAFDIKIRSGEMGFLAAMDSAGGDTVDGKYLKPGAVEQLLPWLPALEQVEDRSRVTPGAIFSLVTVETLWRIVDHHLPGG